MKRKNKKEEWVDDGRTIADMSGITRRNLLIPRPFPEELKEREEEEERGAETSPANPAEPSEGPEVSAADSEVSPASSEGIPTDQNEDLPEKKTDSHTPVSVIDQDGLISDPEEINRRRPWENSSSADKKETLWYVLGTLSAGLLLVLLFIAAGGIIILLMLALWS
ncbi:MAG: hypothetical protein IJL98_01505 [Lachnospiraceae bacterium]|nr:hypothetical protein [Lachnospiraceae bacterium]